MKSRKAVQCIVFMAVVFALALGCSNQNKSRVTGSVDDKSREIMEELYQTAMEHLESGRFEDAEEIVAGLREDGLEENKIVAFQTEAINAAKNQQSYAYVLSHLNYVADENERKEMGNEVNLLASKACLATFMETMDREDYEEAMQYIKSVNVLYAGASKVKTELRPYEIYYQVIDGIAAGELDASYETLKVMSLDEFNPELVDCAFFQLVQKANENGEYELAVDNLFRVEDQSGYSGLVGQAAYNFAERVIQSETLCLDITKVKKALDALELLPDDDRNVAALVADLQELHDAEKENAYQQAIEYFDKLYMYEARELFRCIPGYKDTDEYMATTFMKVEGVWQKKGSPEEIFYWTLQPLGNVVEVSKYQNFKWRWALEDDKIMIKFQLSVDWDRLRWIERVDDEELLYQDDVGEVLMNRISCFVEDVDWMLNMHGIPQFIPENNDKE